MANEYAKPARRQVKEDPSAFVDGGRSAPFDYQRERQRVGDSVGYDYRAAADDDYRAQLDRNARQDREAIGQPQGRRNPRGRDPR